MTGKIAFSPEALKQLEDLGTWIGDAAGSRDAERFFHGLLDHIDRVLMFPRAGRPRPDLRPGLRTTTHKKGTLIAYVVDDSRTDTLVTVLGVFHGGQDWGTALREED